MLRDIEGLTIDQTVEVLLQVWAGVSGACGRRPDEKLNNHFSIFKTEGSINAPRQSLFTLIHLSRPCIFLCEIRIA